MSCLPDELWSRILEIGIQNPNSSLTYKDLCCLSIASRRLHRLSNDEALWSSLISSDFPLNQYPTLSSSSSSSSSSSKALYKIRFERDRDRKLAAHRRTVLRIESQVAEHSRKLQEIKLRSVEETEKMKAAVAELSNLRKVRQASVALNVWQPEVIRGRHKQIVEQCVVPADSRIHALEMELRLCKQQIAGLDKAYVSEVPNMFHLLNFGAWDRTFMMLLNVTWQKDERKRFDAAKEQLTSTKYHPLRNYNLASDGVDKYGMKRKKFIKEHINVTKESLTSLGINTATGCTPKANPHCLPH